MVAGEVSKMPAFYVLVPLLVGISGTATAKVQIFPESLSTEEVSCPQFRLPDHRGPILSDFERSWYSSQLEAAGETSLPRPAEIASSTTKFVIRFLWLRTFHHPVSIRVVLRDDEGELIARELNGAGGYSPGTVQQQISRQLRKEELDDLRKTLEKAKLEKETLCDSASGFDGSHWIIETVEPSGYRFLDRWTPRKGPVRSVGEKLIELTGWDLKPVY